MAIANVVTRGFGPSAAIKFVVTRGYSLGTKPPPPPAPQVVPHDDYEPWWTRRNRYEQRLDDMRREIGLLPKEAERAVAKAATVILAKPKAAKSEAKAFDMVRHYEAAFKKALRSILAKARAEDIEAQWKAKVKEALVARAEEEELILIAQWLF